MWSSDVVWSGYLSAGQAKSSATSLAHCHNGKREAGNEEGRGKVGRGSRARQGKVRLVSVNAWIRNAWILSQARNPACAAGVRRGLRLMKNIGWLFPVGNWKALRHINGGGLIEAKDTMERKGEPLKGDVGAMR
jgi:hypothetical protein